MPNPCGKPAGRATPAGADPCEIAGRDGAGQIDPSLHQSAVIVKSEANRHVPILGNRHGLRKGRCVPHIARTGSGRCWLQCRSPTPIIGWRIVGQSWRHRKIRPRRDSARRWLPDHATKGAVQALLAVVLEIVPVICRVPLIKSRCKTAVKLDKPAPVRGMVTLAFPEILKAPADE